MLSKFSKKIITLSISMLLIGIPFNCFAQTSEDKNITITTSSTDYNKSLDYNKFLFGVVEKEPLYEGLYDANGNLNLNAIDSVKVKTAFLNRFNKNPELYSYEIDNIDSIVKQVIDKANEFKNNKLGFVEKKKIDTEYAADPLFAKHHWSEGPTVTNTTTHITYGSWVGADNYRSCIAVDLNKTETSTATASIGFEGSTEILDKFGFKVTKGETNTISASTSIGAKVPAWTVFEVRPYIKWNANSYEGIYATEWFSLTDFAWRTEFQTKTGVNNVLVLKNYESWTRQNSAKNPTAPTPLP